MSKIDFRKFIYLYSAGIIAAISIQINWAVRHTTIGFGRRLVILTALSFIGLNILTWFIASINKKRTEHFSEKIALSFVVLNSGFAYTIIYNPIIKLTLLSFHFVMFIAFIGNLYNIQVIEDFFSNWTLSLKRIYQCFNPSLYTEVEIDDENPFDHQIAQSQSERS